MEVEGRFYTTPDIAALAQHPRLYRVVRAAHFQTVTCTHKGGSGRAPTATANRRLFFTLGDFDGTAFTAHVHDAFLDDLLRRMRGFPAWKDATKRVTDRFDFRLHNGLTVQTLFKPKPPFVRSRVVVSEADAAVVLPMRQSSAHCPSAVRVQVVNETPLELPHTKDLTTHSVEIRSFSAFASRAWVYRMSQCWRGATLQQAEEARMLSPPRVEVTLELLHDVYTDVADTVLTTASALLKMKDLLPQNVWAIDRVQFDGSVHLLAK